MALSSEGPNVASADLRFTEDISHRMHVPHHISVTGESSDEYSARAAPKFSDEDGGDVAETVKVMQVPERILVAGGDRHSGSKAPPHEVLMDMQHYPLDPRDNPHILTTPPSTLTLDRRAFPAVDDPEVDITPRRAREEANASTLSIEIEDPLKELRRMKRQLDRLDLLFARVVELEDDNANRMNREYLYILGIGVCFLWLLRNSLRR